MSEVDEVALAGPREAFERFRDHLLAGTSAGLETFLADDAVVETPFAPPGAPRHIEGREAFAARAVPQREALLKRIRFTAVRDVIVHETADPQVAFIEYELEATREPDGLRAAAPFAVVVRVENGRVTLWREYQNPTAMALLATV
ncbi:nuclear transport factor 2 family protein [Sphaerisporangium sp. TRM90804]|uniref:nuclear transport factor 2 family protein n=1 Tax=Sphaerisporangium sp. TRM90804 TaxID=3031113 RepID=UPI00244B2B82|nr:nuclear transport factor 2 family protein [Sphaerisporangium sp. TRM90804]MDH2429161.1 nuclear transport factor 2 family protein [Sphaerisporangium sp. TRM90804]